MGLEVEVKFLVADMGGMRQRVVAAGGMLTKARVWERNVRLDTPENGLYGRDSLLRLRQDTAVTLTFKGPSLETLHGSEVKVREELEVQVSDFDTAVTICQRLGYHPQQVYEKYRETFQLGPVEVVLDELPYGYFVELEGQEADIKIAATHLKLDWPCRIVTNYLGLMRQLRDYHHLPFTDLTFANFAGLDISIADILVAPCQPT